ncbi:MAG: S-adenosylmethionine:tRNA ribosyltransferase-isomerase [Bacteroidales bacterium]
MKPFEDIRPDQYDYDLPDDRIALFPVETRDHSKLLIRSRDGALSHDVFKNIADWLPGGTNLFFNNSKVIPARLIFTKATGSRVEIFCLKPDHPSGYAQSLSSAGSCSWECIVGNLKRFGNEPLELEVNTGTKKVLLSAQKAFQQGNIVKVLFTWNEPGVTFAEIIDCAGKTPLPPYIKREATELDRFRYQTIYSRFDGSVAAPTAGLHFTDRVFDTLQQKEITCHEITLHVGAGTFQPVKTDRITEHRMHSEDIVVHSKLLNVLSNLPGRVTCVGTTTVRTLESLYWLGVKIIKTGNPDPADLKLDQWEAYQLDGSYTLKESFEAFAAWFNRQQAEELIVSTSLMILPGYRFRVSDTLITNFHQPRSTLLLLIAAFIGESWKETYSYALENGFRFLSYGDSSLFFNS